MPLSRLALGLLFFSTAAFAIGDTTQPLHSSGDKQNWDRKRNRVELIGHAIVSQPGETIRADYILLDQNLRTLDARGNCIYVTADSVIHGDEMHFNMDTRTGSIVGGRVSNDQFTLSGERINKLGEGRYQTHWGEYTTCRDCASSWSLMGRDVDMEFEGYAYMSNVTVKVKDSPAVWFPYLVVPMKTHRQSGLLFPSFGASQLNGVMFVLPIFWAISRSVDMTFGLGDYTNRGIRFEWESRYQLRDGNGQSNFYYLRDSTFVNTATGSTIPPLFIPYRWAANVYQQQSFPLGIEEKFRFTEVSDNLYPIQVGDVPGQPEQFMPSYLTFSRTSDDVSAFVGFRRYRNLMNTESQVDFDAHTVQAYPSAVITTNDKFLFGTPVAVGLTLGLDNFTRSESAYDFDICSICSLGFGATPPPAARPGIDPLRKGTRISTVPSLYTTLRPLDVLSLVPSAKYYIYNYDFHGAADNLSRSYMLLQVDLSTQFEKIYESSEKGSNRYKHLIRPKLTYSRIPEQLVREDVNHPFIKQINLRQGYYFDDNDIVPIDASPANFRYFVPLGDSLNYGFTTQLIRRDSPAEAETSGYTRMIELSAGQAYNFYAERRPVGEQQPFSRLYSNLILNLGRFSSSTTYLYFPNTPGVNMPSNVVSTSAAFVFERGVHQRMLQYDRSVSLGYSIDRTNCVTGSCGSSDLSGGVSWSINDYWLPSASVAHSFISHEFHDAILNLSFQSPSRCYRLNLNVTHKDNNVGTIWGVDLTLNLTGAGYGGVTEFANQVVSH